MFAVAATAQQAREQAQRIAFGPSVFQSALVLRDSGILEKIERCGATGLTLDEIATGLAWSAYAVRVLLDAAVGMGLVTLDDNRYRCTKTAWFLLHDPMTRVNMNFSQSVTYKGMQALAQSLHEGRPAGLAVFGNWPTLYAALAHLPAQTLRDWLAFDHYYSDLAFAPALALLARRAHRRVMDIGGNTGRFAQACVASHAATRVTIVDLPGQIAMARSQFADVAGSERIDWHAANVLDLATPLPADHDAIWMSQFLDCFAENEIVSILERCAAALAPSGTIYILEPFWNLQKQAAAAFCLQQTSLYFAALANGNSRMYTSDVMTHLVRRAGLELQEIVHPVGIVHSLMICRKATEPRS